jgi:hypothetical protein
LPYPVTLANARRPVRLVAIVPPLGPNWVALRLSPIHTATAPVSQTVIGLLLFRKWFDVTFEEMVETAAYCPVKWGLEPISMIHVEAAS